MSAAHAELFGTNTSSHGTVVLRTEACRASDPGAGQAASETRGGRERQGCWGVDRDGNPVVTWADGSELVLDRTKTKRASTTVAAAEPRTAAPPPREDRDLVEATPLPPRVQVAPIRRTHRASSPASTPTVRVAAASTPAATSTTPSTPVHAPVARSTAPAVAQASPAAPPSPPARVAVAVAPPRPARDIAPEAPPPTRTRPAGDFPRPAWCGDARFPHEREVCSDPELAERDLHVAVLWRRYRQAIPPMEAAWIKRDYFRRLRGCGGDRDCIRDEQAEQMRRYEQALVAGH